MSNKVKAKVNKVISKGKRYKQPLLLSPLSSQPKAGKQTKSLRLADRQKVKKAG